MEFNPYWRIWYKVTPKDGSEPFFGVSTQVYVRKGNANRTAKKRYGHPFPDITVEWKVSKENPWKQMQEGQ